MGQRIKRMEQNDVAEGLSFPFWKPEGFRYILS